MSRSLAIVDDDHLFAQMLARHLSGDGFAVSTFGTLAEVDASEDLELFDLFIVDVNLPDGSGMDLLERLGARESPPETIVVTGQPSFENAVDALRLGIVDFFSKPVELEQIRLAILRTVDTRRMRRKLAAGRPKPEPAESFVDSLGVDDSTRALIVRASEAELPVFITGETGTGKTMMARWIHDNGPRAQAPFVATNCAALPGTLIEAELFGVEKGAFTGADRTRQGLFELAHEGTLFLDEISEMPLELQPKLLHALESGAIRRVGGNVERRFDVRVVAASNVDPLEAVASGKLREDVSFRLGVVPLCLPPLRERTAQLEGLVERILRSLDPRLRMSDLAPGELDRLRAHPWPGNVRELCNVFERAQMMREGLLEPSRFMVTRQRAEPARRPSSHEDDGPLLTLEEMERSYIERVLDSMRGNRTQTARVLDIAESTLRRKLKQYGHAPRGS